MNGAAAAVAALRKIIDEILLEGQADSAHNVFNLAGHRANERGVPFDGRAALEYWWELARVGVVALPGDKLASTIHPVPSLVVTDRGRKLLGGGRLSPHDEARYLAAIRERIADPDAVTLAYLAEAIGGWRAGLCRSSAVMLGCACERLILLLAHRIAGATLPPWSSRLARSLGRKAPTSVSTVYEDVRSALTASAGAGKLPGHLSDGLDRRLSAIFDHARRLRNEQGHPVDKPISAEDAEAGLLLFPGFYTFVDEVSKSIQL